MNPLLLRLKCYDEFDCEYELSMHDAQRLAAIVGHPGARKCSRAFVTFLHEGLDNEVESERVKGEADDEGRFQLEFPDAVRLPHS